MWVGRRVCAGVACRELRGVELYYLVALTNPAFIESFAGFLDSVRVADPDLSGPILHCLRRWWRSGAR